MGALGTSNSVAVILMLHIYNIICIYIYKIIKCMTILDIFKHDDSIEDCRNM